MPRIRLSQPAAPVLLLLLAQAALGQFQITTPSPLPSWTVGVSYSQTLAASGGTQPYNWQVVSGGLPPGLNLSAAGQITGTPTTPATSPYAFRIRVTDSAAATAEKDFLLAINPLPSIIGPASLPAGTLGTVYPATQVTASGGTGSYTWSATGLPAGLSIDPASGVISGTPTTIVGSPFSVTVTVSDTVSATASRPYSVTVTSPIPTVTGLSPNGAIAGGPDFTLTVNGTSFVTGAVVNWNAGPLSTTLVSVTQLTAAVPAANIAAAGSAAITVTNPGPVTSAPATFTVIAQLTIATAALPSGVTGAAYSANLAASGGTAPHAWSISMGTLPPGLALEPATGLISGTPTTAGNYAFTARVTDGGTPPLQQTATRPLAINVVSGLAVTTSILPAGTAGTPYSQTLTAAGGIGPYSWAVTAGALPPGLSLGSGTGQITGTPVAAGTYSFTVQVTDASSATATKALSITVTTALTIVTSMPLPDAVVGRAYTVALSASGGTPPYMNWVIVTGALPSGLTLSATTGFLSGMPVATGSFTFVVQVYDTASATATKYFTITVSASLSITTASLPSGVTGVSYAQSLAVAGGTAPFTWTLAAGALPPGLSLTLGTGTISGIPTQTGSYSFTIRVTDATSATATRDFTVTIGEGVTITTPTQLPTGTVGSTYSTSLTVSGGRAPFTWSVASGSLPPGLSLSAAGVISGTPTTAGNYSFVLQVTDSSTPPASATKAVSVVITAGLAITTPAQLPSGTVGVGYSQTLAATGGTSPYSWAVSQGSLPAGLSLSSSGILAGTPTTQGAFSFTVQVTDGVGRKATQDFSLTIGTGMSIATPSPLPTGTVGVSYSQTLAATGGTPPYSDWKVISGILPAGLSLNAATGSLFGTPTAATVLRFTVQVQDSTGKTASKEFTLTVQAPPLVISTASPLPTATLGRAYAQTLAASGGTAPYAWGIAEGSLPAGLNLEASNGQIRGTPTALGTSEFTIRVTDSAGKAATKAFTLSVEPPAAPAAQILGPADTAEPAQQPPVRLTLAAGYPLPITGRLALTFDPDAVNPSDDPAVQFTTGGRTATFTVAAGATEATFPSASLALQTGTVAGAITLRATFQAGGRDVTPSPAPVKVSRVLRSAPVIRSVRVERSGSGFDVLVTGFSTPRQVTQATFRFTPASGATLQTTEISLPMTQLSDAWFQGQESREYGSQFTLRQSFTVQGDLRAVGSVSVTLTNAVGSSQAVSAGL